MELDVGHPVFLAPGEGEKTSDSAERTVAIKAEHELVDVTESRYEPGERGPDPHVHRRHTDAFYVLAGELRFGLGPELADVDAPAGTLVLVPAGVVHTFGNEGTSTARFLNFHAPSMGFAESLRARRDSRHVEQERFDSYAPPPDGGRPAADAVIRGPGEGARLVLGASSATLQAEGGDGDGTLSVSETLLAPGFPGPVAHRHETFLDGFFVLDGTLAVRLAETRLQLPPGSFLLVPPGVVHTFSNPGDDTVRLLNLMAPGGFEQHLKEVARTGRPPDPSRMAAIASKYDFHPASC